MRLAWFTPFCKTSAIGHVGQTVAAALARMPGYEVDIWTHHKQDLYPTRQRVRHFDGEQVSPRDLAGYDHVIYNLGNYLPFHLPIFEVAQRHPGVVVLHDACMHQFFAGYYLSHLRDAGKYLDVVDGLYGEEARRKVAAGLNNGSYFHETDGVVAYPLWEPCLASAKAVVVHSHFGADLLRPKCHLPIATLSLPHFDYGDIEKIIPSLDRGAVGDDGRIHVLTAGHVNPNKRTHMVLEVLGRSKDLKNAVTFRVIGPRNNPAYEKMLRELIHRHDLHSNVELLGYQPDAVLYQHLCEAHICVNLRHPVFETGSASLIEAMHFGLPTIVTDIGAYQDVPATSVCRVSVENEHQDLCQALRTLVFDADQRRHISQEAREYIRRHCNAEAYAEGIVELLELLADDPTVKSNFLNHLGEVLLEHGEVRNGAATGTIACELARFWP